MLAPKASSTALREALQEHCRLAGWAPRHIGQPGHEPGLEEVLLEIIATRDAEATRLSLELIERCEQLGWQSPWLLDNRARCLVHEGDHPAAQAIWQALCEHPDPAVRSTATDTLAALESQDPVRTLALRVLQLRERDQPEAWKPLLLEACLRSPLEPESLLQQVVEIVSADFAPPPGSPWDPDLLRQELLLALYEQQLNRWEDQLP